MTGLRQGAQVSCVRHQGVQVRWYAVPFPKGMLCFRLGGAVLWVWAWGCYAIDGAIIACGMVGRERGHVSRDEAAVQGCR